MNFHSRPRQSDRLNLLWLELTSKCNLECIHCYADSGPGNPLHEAMTFADWERALAEAANLGCRNVQFIGGEPTLYPRLAELIAWARTCEFKMIEVYTNGLHFTPLLRDAFVKHQVHLAFSFYSSEAPVHDAITKRKNSWVRTIDSIRWALAAGLPARVGIIGMDLNNGHIEQTREFLAGLGVRDAKPDRVRGIGRGAHMRPAQSPYHELCGQCLNGRLCVTASGQIYPCVFSRFSPVGVFANGLHTAVRSSALRDFKIGLRSTLALTRPGYRDDYSPEEPTCGPDPCNPETPPDPCRPEINPGPCTPEIPHVCNPELKS